jgi:hypothetical protein
LKFRRWNYSGVIMASGAAARKWEVRLFRAFATPARSSEHEEREARVATRP